MFNHELFAVSFARTVHVMRAVPPVVSQQKGALRAVYALTSIAPATVRVYDGVLSVDDVAMSPNTPHVPELIGQMEAHGVSEVAIARGASPADLLALVRALAVEPGGFKQGDGVERRVRDSGAVTVAVISVQHVDERPEGHRPASVTQAFEMAGIEELVEEAPPPPPTPPQPSTPSIPSIPPGVPDPLADWETMHTGAHVADERYAHFAPDVDPEAEAPAPVEEQHRTEPTAEEPALAALPEDLPVPADSPLGQALLDLRRHPYGNDVLDRLTELGRAVQLAMQADEVWKAVRAMASAIVLEPDAPEGSPKASYAIALKRMLPKEVLAQIAPLLLVEDEAASAAFVLHRAGSDGADVLLGLLATADTIRERRAYMHALRGIPQGTDLVLQMLNKPQWFVVRNVAELCGELRIEIAVPELARLLNHSDIRVQRAAAVALAKIGTTPTVSPLLKLLKEGSRELRGMVVAAVGRRGAPALAMPIAALAAEEDNAELLREYYRALGRIGTQDAVQVLAKAAQPGGRLLSRRPTAVRLAAVEGLKLAGTRPAVTALNGLVTDTDKSVATSARSALEAIRAGMSEA